MSKKSDHLDLRKMSSLMAIVSFSLIFLLARPAWDREPQKVKVVLSLQQLISMAIARSPELGAVHSEIAAARSDLEQVKAAYYPQLDSTGIVGPAPDASEPVIRNNRIYDPSPSPSLANTGIFGRLDFTLRQPLHTFGKLSNRKEAASRGLKAKKFELAKTKSEIALRVKQLYYALLISRGGIAAASDAGAFFDDARSRIKRLLELGSANVTESDLYRLEAYRANTIRSRAEAEKGAKLAYFALKSMIGLDPGKEFDIPEKSLPMREEKLGDLQSYIKEAVANRPEFKQLKEAISAQEFQVKAAESDRYPSLFVALEGSFAEAPGRDHFDNPYIPDEYNHGYAGVIAGIKWNFDFGISRAKINKMRAEYQKLRHTKATAEMKIPIQVAKCYQEVLEWKKAVEAYHEAAVASRKWVVSSLGDFDMGLGTAEDMLNAIERYGSNRGKYLEALFNYNLSLARLEYAIGTQDWEDDGEE